MNGNDTYAHYGEVLKNTPYYTNHTEEAYIPYCEDFSNLNQETYVGTRKCANRIAYQPMEGQDADLDGSPTPLTFERYIDLAKGGAGLMWFEAVSINHEGKSNPYQLCITKDNLPKFKELCSAMKKACLEANGYEPLIIFQINHSGRYSKPDGTPSPITAYFNPDIEDSPKKIATDEYLKGLIPQFVQSAVLVEQAGFDGFDLKVCHGYLLSELTSAYDRSGDYGGCFENRTRLIREIVHETKKHISKDFIFASRINAFDGFAGKYSFGKSDSSMYDLTEISKLISFLSDNGCSLINITMGSPYRNPDVSRPYRKGLDAPKSDAIYSLYRLWSGAKELKQKFPNIKFVNTGISLLGSLSPYAASGAIKEDYTDFVGFGRMSLAYPHLAKDILTNHFDAKLCCVCCGGCSTLKKNVLKSGCIVRNSLYRDIYKDFIKGEK